MNEREIGVAMVMSSTKCKCGMLNKWAQDPNTRIVGDKESGNCFVAIAPSTTVPVMFCPSCGARDERFVENYDCSCRSVQGWAEDPDFYVVFDRQFNEYSLTSRDDQNILFHYCPTCGGNLPGSARSEFFEQPSVSEMSELRRKLSSVKSLEDVIALLGPPDEALSPATHDPAKKAIYGLEDIKQTLKYGSVSETLDLSVSENEKGQIRI